MKKETKRVALYRSLLSPLAHDRSALSVVFTALSNYGSDDAERVEIANDLADAAYAVLGLVDRETERRRRMKTNQ